MTGPPPLLGPDVVEVVVFHLVGINEPRVVELVGELSLLSPVFRQLWARHDIAERTGANVTLDHPAVGQLRLDREKLAIAGTDGIMLVIYHAEAGTELAEHLGLLGSLTTPPVVATPRPTNTRTARQRMISS